MNPGDLKQKITIVEDVITVNDKGFKVSDINTIGVYRAKAQYLNTREIYRLEKINLKVSIKFTIRNIRHLLDEKQKILFQGNTYTISYIEEVFDNSRYITIYAEKIEGK